MRYEMKFAVAYLLAAVQMCNDAFDELILLSGAFQSDLLAILPEIGGIVQVEQLGCSDALYDVVNRGARRATRSVLEWCTVLEMNPSQDFSLCQP